MQRYNKILEMMFNQRFIMFKMRELTHFRLKITQIQHF